MSEQALELKKRGIKFVENKPPDRPIPNLPERPKNKQKTEEPPSTTETDQPHDSAYVHSALKEKHTLKVLPEQDTRKKGNSQTIILVALFVLTFFSAWGLAYGVQIALTPHTPGICAAPAVIEKGGCFTVETATGANGQTITTLIPAGHLAG